MIICDVEVTEEDVKNGKQGRPNLCPVALAIRKIFKDAFHFRVRAHHDIQSGWWWTVNVQSHKGSLSFTLPDEIVKRVKAYDETGLMDPFTFPLEI